MQWARLADQIRAASATRFATRRDFADAAGLSLRTIEDLLAGQRRSYRERTLQSVEVALGWQAGSVARVLEGRKPVNAPDALLAQVLDVWPRLGQRDRRLLAVLLAELTR